MLLRRQRRRVHTGTHGLDCDIPCSTLLLSITESSNLSLQQDRTAECGPACTCSLACGRRKSQQGLSTRLELRKCQGKGWGVFAAEDLARGAFVCLYVGEYLNNSQANRRLQNYDTQHIGHALLVRFALSAMVWMSLSLIKPSGHEPVSAVAGHPGVLSFRRLHQSEH